MQSLLTQPETAKRQSPFRSLRVWIGLPVSLVFLFLAFRGQDPAEIRDALSRVDWRWLPLAFILLYTGIIVRAYRWHVLLRPIHDIPTRDVFPIMIIGYAANNVLPLRVGELVRAWVLDRRYGVRKTAALATIAIERLFDGVTMLLFVGGAAVVVGLNSELQHLALVAAAVFAVAIAGLAVLLFGGGARDRLLHLVLGPLPAPLAERVERMAESFLAGLGVLSRRRDLAVVAATSVIAWGFEAATYWSVAQSFGPPLAAAMTPVSALLTTAIANLATLVPSGPGYVGTFEAGVLLAVNGALGIGRGLALSFAVLLHALLWAPVTVWGAIEWWRLGLAGTRHVSLTQAVEDELLPGPGTRLVTFRRGRPVSVWQAIVLGIVQGLTEFLPVSSSAHLLAVPWLLGWEEPGLAFDAALHLGTLAAVLVYFWREIVAMAVAFPRAILRPGAVLRSRDPAGATARLSLLIALGTVPGLAFGLLGQKTIDAVYHPGGVTPDRVIVAIAVALIALALLLLWAERTARHVRQMDSLTVSDAVIIGLAQAGALIPGVSRSGATITAGLFRGLTRADAARFSFLLGSPIIAAAGAKGLLDTVTSGLDAGQLGVFAVGLAASALAGFAAIWALLRYLQRASTAVFIAYRIALGVLLLALVAVR